MDAQYRKSLLSFLLVIGLIVVANLQSLDNSFHYDDGHAVQRNPHIRELTNLPLFFVDTSLFSENPDYGMYRPLVLTTHALNYAVGKDAPTGYLAVNIAIHALVSGICFVILLQLGFGLSLAILGSLLFGLHPVQSEVVNFVSARSESLAACFVLLSFSAYLRSTRTAESSLEIGSQAYQILSLIAFALGLLSKATAIVLPSILIGYAWLRKPRWRDLVAVQFPYWIVAVVYGSTYLVVGSESIAKVGAVRSVVSQVATQAKALIHYVKLTIIPSEVSIYRQFFISETLFELAPLLGAFAVLSIAGIAWLSIRQRPMAAFGMGWFFVSLAPTVIIPLNLAVNDHRLYLALFGIVILLSTICTGPRCKVFLTGLCVMFAANTVRNSPLWQDELRLWSHAVAHAPLMPEAHYNLAFEYHERGEIEPARIHYERAISLRPSYGEALANLAALHRSKGRLDEAELSLRKALLVDPDLPGALNSLGLLLMDRGTHVAAEKIFKQILRRDPNVAEAHFNLGLIYRNRGDTDLAVQYLSRAISLKPDLKTTTQSSPVFQR